VKRRNFRLTVSAGSAEAIVKCGKIKYRLTAYFLSNISAKNYQNRLMYVEVIPSQSSVIRFLEHSVVCNLGLVCCVCNVVQCWTVECKRWRCAHLHVAQLCYDCGWHTAVYRAANLSWRCLQISKSTYQILKFWLSSWLMRYVLHMQHIYRMDQKTVHQWRHRCYGSVDDVIRDVIWKENED